jgi:FKBP-type peptidyl-prolyl cis-trans isomerase
MALAAIGLVGCSSDSGGESQSADAAASLSNEDGPIATIPSGVRYQDLQVGEGNPVVDQMLVKYEYAAWFADKTGLTKERMFHSSVASEQPYFGQVGVTLIAGLNEGLVGMREGGFRRIFVPSDLAYGEKPPFGGNNIIFEIWDLREASPAEVHEYQTTFNNAEAMRKRAAEGPPDHDH